MLTAARLADTGTFTIDDVQCHAGHEGWSGVEEARGYVLVFVRRGCFYRRSYGVETLVDPATAYGCVPGEEQQIAHPADAGDRCTALGLTESAFAALTGVQRGAAARLFTTSETDLQHRRLLAVARRGTDELELDEGAWWLASSVLRLPPPRPGGGPATARRRRRVVDGAREAIAARPWLTLRELSDDLAVSPHHLSRIFRTATGSTLTRYRNSVRVRLALERLAEGERSLARVAAELGFADQAHLTRVTREQVGATPAALRRALASTG
jgi:AraC-like DNA-binding protein